MHQVYTIMNRVPGEHRAKASRCRASRPVSNVGDAQITGDRINVQLPGPKRQTKPKDGKRGRKSSVTGDTATPGPNVSV